MALLRSVVKKFRSGLEKTRQALVDPIIGLVRGRTLDEALIRDIERALIQADVGVPATRELVDGLREAYKSKEIERGEDVVPFLRARLASMWPEQDRTLNLSAPAGTPSVILVAGVNGAGKTTSIAKLANRLKDEGRSVMLCAGDTFRAGAVRQLEVWSERLGVPLIKGQQGGDPAAVVFDGCEAAVARGVDVLIVDTAGRLQTQRPLMDELAKIRKVVARRIEGAPHETLLVLDATTGQNAVRQAEAFGEAIEPTGIVLSKLDGTARGGVVIAVQRAAAIPVKLVGVGESIGDLEAFDPEAFVAALFDAGE